MTTLGIVCVKTESKRFPGKNFKTYKGLSLWEGSVETLWNCPAVDKVIVCSDSSNVEAQCSVDHIWQPLYSTGGDSTITDMLRYAYMAHNKYCEYIVTIFANAINHTSEDVQEAHKLIREAKLQEVRGYNKDSGVENGLIMVTRDRLLNGSSTGFSSYLGAILTNGKEVHSKEELF